jgi:hypothetical protein
MADREIDLKIVVDDSGAIQSINGVDEAIQKTKKDTEGLGETGSNAFRSWAVSAATFLTSVVGVTASINTLKNSLNLAREVEDLSASFELLSSRVGNDAAAKIEELRKATQGMTSDVDLFRATNQALLLGVDEGSGKFEELTQAAVKLGNSMGISTTEAVNSLVLGLGRQSKMILDNLGIIVDAEAGYQRYADSIGKTVGALTEAEKKQAFINEGFRAITETAAGLAPSADTAASAFERLGVSFENARSNFALGVSSSTDLANALKDIGVSLDSIGWQQAGRAFGDFMSYAVSAINTLKGVNDSLNDLGLTLNLAFKNITSPDSFAAFTSPILSAQVEVQKLKADMEKLQSSTSKVGPQTAAFNAYKDIASLVEKAGNTAEIAAPKIEKVGTATVKAAKAAKEAKKPFDEISSSLQSMIISLDETNQYESAVTGLFDAFKAGEIDTSVLGKAFENLANDAAQSELGIGNLKEAMSMYGKEAEKVQETTDKGFLGGLFDPNSSQSSSLITGFTEQLGQDLSNSITGAITTAFEGGSVRDSIAGMGAAIGQAGGQALGAAFAGPAGAAIGGSLGSVLGDKVFEELSQFGKKSGQSIGQGIGLALGGITGGFLGGKLGGLFDEMSRDEKLRRAFGDSFNKIIEQADIDILKFLDTDNVQQKFEDLNLDGVLQPQFDGIAASLATTFGLLEEGGDSMLNQFSQILAVNFQNVEGLNDLQIILQQAGMDAETLQANLEAAYLQGDLGAGEFLNANAQIENLFQQGIPGAIGATDTAFMNFVTNGLNSGAEAKDALGDLGAEMTEALNGGVSSLAELQEKLIAQGADAGKVAKLFEALGSAGISTIEQLTNISTIQSATITNQLQQVQGFFAETTNQVAELENQINALDNKEINIKVKYSSEYDSQTTKEAVEGGTGSTGLGAG